jgi:hypothetical protein
VTAPIPIDDPVFAPVVTALYEIDHRAAQRMERVRDPNRRGRSRSAIWS